MYLWRKYLYSRFFIFEFNTWVYWRSPKYFRATKKAITITALMVNFTSAVDIAIKFRVNINVYFRY